MPLLLLGEMPAKFEESTAQIESDDDENMGLGADCSGMDHVD